MLNIIAYPRLPYLCSVHDIQTVPDAAPCTHRVQVLYPRDLAADWELWLTAAVQRHGRVLCWTSLVWGKDQNSQLEVWVYWMCITFAPSNRQKNLKSYHHKFSIAWISNVPKYVCWKKVKEILILRCLRSFEFEFQFKEHCNTYSWNISNRINMTIEMFQKP